MYALNVSLPSVPVEFSSALSVPDVKKNVEPSVSETSGVSSGV